VEKVGKIKMEMKTEMVMMVKQSQFKIKFILLSIRTTLSDVYFRVYFTYLSV